jgi:ABC-type oligopeptide transport system substrate-binding subunit
LGVFGAVTDPSIGQGYDPALAKKLFQAYLTESGFTVADFNSAYQLGLVQISSGDTVNQAVVRQWQEVLGVKVEIVTVADNDLKLYDRKNVPLDQTRNMFQGNWCADYPDQDNFIRGLFNAQSGSNNVRRNCADAVCTAANAPNKFDQLTAEAGTITDPEQRKVLYAQAEQILAVDEAAYAPLFFGAGISVNQSWLTRNYPVFGAPDFFNWMIDTTAQVKP